MNITKKIMGGVYLVIDPGWESTFTFPRLTQALKAGISALQIWDNWPAGMDKLAFIQEVTSLAHARDVPVLINNNPELLGETPLDGIHFDSPCIAIDQMESTLGRSFLKGITCGNDLTTVHWANDRHFDYISFCSLFPSASADSCEIVSKETLQKARKLTKMPIFVAGGISLENITTLQNCGINGAALISAIMQSADPFEATQLFNDYFNTVNS
ncbi:thiamine phosphate synthase [Runella slithyformis]|uniref:Thiamine monophosphate synthase n=1 Tax=Runella slithyformis (strain ATCC 29530 / DSM 19594 / LMG 11500 / NCIMB 11436 / LSU 4) TaxID=761193 RepID=A0A7U4E6J3_RUNSL|nr:thiamine phosphate synthase [Runella slithyformis]AEI49623.1 thiamine monophosphate synthase [Runella slithyformis DSM 19594]